jgi:serine protease Do
MENKKKNIYDYSFSIFLAVFIIILVFFYLRLNSHNLSFFSLDSDSYSDNKIIEHPQYDIVSNLQSAFIRNAKIVGPSVVSLSKIKSKSNINYSNELLHKKDSWLFPLKEWFYEHFSKKRYTSEAIGSGVIINSNGYILTNYHVIDGHEKILVRLSDQRTFFAKVIGTDLETDIAVIKINSFRKLPRPIFGVSSKIKVGQWVMAIGNPYGLQGSVTVGVVSGIGRSNLGIATYENFLQTDASINPGNSGGPLINLSGEIVAINTSSVAFGSGVGFAIPIEMALRISEELINNGNVQRGWIGIGIQEMTPELFLAFKLPGYKKGILVNNVKNNTPAKKAGFMRGDIVLKYNGKKVRSIKKFKFMVAGTQIGKKIPIDVIRNRLEKTLLITIGELTF